MNVNVMKIGCVSDFFESKKKIGKSPSFVSQISFKKTKKNEKASTFLRWE